MAPMTEFDAQRVHTDIVAFARMGSRVCNDFKIPLVNRATFDATMDSIDGCNNFAPKSIAKTFGDLWSEIMSFAYAVEGSPALYIDLPYWTSQRNGGRVGDHAEYRKYTNEERRALAERVVAWARSENVDTIRCWQGPGTEPVIGAVGDAPSTIRLWWD